MPFKKSRKHGGSPNTASGANAEPSAKGLKAVVALTVESGTFDIDSFDDAIHSDGLIIIDGGTFNIATGDAVRFFKREQPIVFLTNGSQLRPLTINNIRTTVG
jgi:hypothetical protein